MMNNDPLKFTIDEGEVIPGLELAMMDISPGEAKSTEILANQGYGPNRENKVVAVNRSQFPLHLDLQIGTILRLCQAGGKKSGVSSLCFLKPGSCWTRIIRLPGKI
jgi:peptidylprolyl isomerase